jgi:hypothetical protein
VNGVRAMLRRFWDWCCRVFAGSHGVAQKIHDLDEQQREVRHDLKNVQARADALARLVEGMREDDTWRKNKAP